MLAASPSPVVTAKNVRVDGHVSPGSRLERGRVYRRNHPGRAGNALNEFHLTLLAHRQENTQPFVEFDSLTLVQGHRRGQGRVDCVLGVL